MFLFVVYYLVFAQLSPQSLPSPFLVVDHILNALVYGAFYEPSSKVLNEFLVPMMAFGTPLSYGLGALYSYLYKETTIQTVILVWAEEQYDCPCVSSAQGVAPVLWKTIFYDKDCTENMPFSVKEDVDLGMDNPIIAQHLPYIALWDLKVVLCALSWKWLSDHYEEFSAWVQNNTLSWDVAIIYLDDFTLKEIDGHKLDMEMQHDSLSAYYHQQLRDRRQDIHLLAVQPYEYEDIFQAVLGM